ncbi:MAG: CRISPR system precrRNA processing endoribonuclease RAMP protein Cas6 [Desulfurococcales archaeon]|nr:CRISPR system precrRNA processing endoribonuclease RAMP protein Cas6 [Desulfurococcales archaeon]
MYILRFSLRALNAGGIPWFTGHETRAGFLDLVRKGNEELAGELHDTKGIYSLKALTFKSKSKIVWKSKTRIPGYGIVRPIDAGILYEEGALGEFQVTLYKPEILTKLVTALSHGIRGTIKIHMAEFKVEELNIEAINTDQILEDAKPLNSLDLYFISPTYFNPPGGGNYKIIYPHIPSLLKSLTNTLAHVTNAKPDLEKLTDKIFLSGIDIRTPSNKNPETPTPQGFLGWTRLRLDQLDKEEQKLIVAALMISEYTGVGGNRTGGYGEIKIKYRKLSD